MDEPARESMKRQGTRASTPWDVVERYAEFLVKKFGTRINKTLWDSTKTECKEMNITWLSSTALKGGLGHYAVCVSAPHHVKLRAASLIKQLSRPDLLDPWQFPPNKTCPYCFNTETTAVVADVDEKDGAEIED
jgi:hypothetical protein